MPVCFKLNLQGAKCDCTTIKWANYINKKTGHNEKIESIAKAISSSNNINADLISSRNQIPNQGAVTLYYHRGIRGLFQLLLCDNVAMYAQEQYTKICLSFHAFERN